MPADVAVALANYLSASGTSENANIPSGYDYLGAGYNATKAGVAIIEALAKELPGGKGVRDI